MKFLITILLGCLLVSCTSKPLDVHYYMLHTPQLQTPTPALPTKVVLQNVQIADYLRQSSLSMQIGQHEMYYSRQDVWAEPLKSAFSEALIQDLNSFKHHSYVQPNIALELTNVSAHINIKLQHFHITDDSQVITSGQYWITPNLAENSLNETSELMVQTFYFALPLKQDGYPHAVEQMRLLVTMLSEQIDQDIKKTMEVAH